MWNHFKHIARGGLIDLSMLGATHRLRDDFAADGRRRSPGAAITAGFMVAYNAVWRFSPRGKRA